MADQKGFAEKLMSGAKTSPEEPRNAATGEWQPSAESFSVEVIFKDGRRSRGFAMSHYSDYEWSDEGHAEKLTILFGMRAIIVEGELLLEGIAGLLKDGRLRRIQELTTREVQELRRDNPYNKPIVTRVTVEPDLQLILNAIRGEEDETRYPRRVK